VRRRDRAPQRVVHGRQRVMSVRLAAALTLVLALAGGADAQLVDCLGGQRPTQVAELMFGRNIGNRIGVSEGDFGRFVDREILSRFPHGLTVFNAAGQWREQASDKIVREPSKVVQIVPPAKSTTLRGSTRSSRPIRGASSSNRWSWSCGRPACRSSSGRLPGGKSAPRHRLRPRRVLPNYLGNAENGRERASWSR